MDLEDNDEDDLEVNYEDLNKTGEITGQYGNGRVGVKVDGLEEAVAVKPRNIQIFNQ